VIRELDSRARTVFLEVEVTNRHPRSVLHRTASPAMSNFRDLSAYTYDQPARTGVELLNVGWLGPGSEFDIQVADPGFLEALWQYCLISVNQTRGLYRCHVCNSPDSGVAERQGQRAELGSAEIRVFSRAGVGYAAPNLIYHCVAAHDYLPPADFVEAVKNEPRPPISEYFKRLSEFGISWSPVLVPSSDSLWIRFVRTAEGVKRIEE
jgi:hypothetical protein